MLEAVHKIWCFEDELNTSGDDKRTGSTERIWLCLFWGTRIRLEGWKIELKMNIQIVSTELSVMLKMSVNE